MSLHVVNVKHIFLHRRSSNVGCIRESSFFLHQQISNLGCIRESSFFLHRQSSNVGCVMYQRWWLFTHYSNSVGAGENVKLLRLLERDLGGLNLENVVTCCLERFPLRLNATIYKSYVR